MNVHVEKGYITKMDCNSNFSYILNDNNIFLSTEYKVLQSQDEGCFAICNLLSYMLLVFYFIIFGVCILRASCSYTIILYLCFDIICTGYRCYK